MKTTPCKYCRKFIFFAKGPSDRLMPMDEDPVSLGEWVLLSQDRTPEAAKLESLTDVEKVAFRDRYRIHRCDRRGAH